MYAAAKLYYLDEVRQGEIAERLELSPATVSRLLAEARRSGMVRIEVMPPDDDGRDELERRLEAALSLDAVAITGPARRKPAGRSAAPALSTLPERVGLRHGDALLVSLGRTVYEIAQAELPQLPGVQLAPMVGGQDEPEVWYASNEPTRQVAAKVGGTPHFLYAPALLGEQACAVLLEDPSIKRSLALWAEARCAIVGIVSRARRPLNLEEAKVAPDAAGVATSVDQLTIRRAWGDDRGNGIGSMRLDETLRLMRVARPPAPYGARTLARCYSIDDVAKKARRRLPAGAWAYLDGGGEGEYTLRRNRAAFDRLEFLPDMPRDVGRVDMRATVLGQRVALPIALSPVGAPRMFHHDGELAVARAAGSAGIPYGISTLATASVEDVAAQTESPLWFQLYVWGDRGEAKEAVARARAAGFGALLFSIDTTVRSKREREKRAGLHLPMPYLAVRTFLEGALHPGWAWHFLTSDTISFPNIGPADHRSLEKIAQMFDGTVRWQDLDWIRALWDGPILIKGVMRPEEAVRAADAGLEGVIVSNHGGRQLDHLPATIDVLPEIIDAVGDRVEVLVDSGFRRGSDIATALALGAKAVLVGRAHLYGLAAAGEAGVRHCIDILAEELRMTLALCGARNVAELDRGLIRRRPVADDPDPATA